MNKQWNKGKLSEIEPQVSITQETIQVIVFLFL